MLSHPIRLSSCLTLCKIDHWIHWMDVQPLSLLCSTTCSSYRRWTNLYRLTHSHHSTLLNPLLYPPTNTTTTTTTAFRRTQTKTTKKRRVQSTTNSAIPSQRQPNSSQRRGCDMANKRQMTFEANENVLCFHGPLLYEAKVMTFFTHSSLTPSVQTTWHSCGLRNNKTFCPLLCYRFSKQTGGSLTHRMATKAQSTWSITVVGNRRKALRTHFHQCCIQLQEWRLTRTVLPYFFGGT